MFKHFFNCFLFRHSLTSLGRGPMGRPKQPREEASSPGDGHQDQVGGRDRQLERDRPLLLRSPGIPRSTPTPTNTAVCRGKNTFTKKTAFGTLGPAGYHCRCEARAGEEQSLATVPHCAHFPAGRMQVPLLPTTDGRKKERGWQFAFLPCQAEM